MLDIKCYKCGKDLEEPGALIFSPPKDNRVDKIHLCIICWRDLRDWLVGGYAWYLEENKS